LYVDPQVFGIAFLLATAAIALWFDNRFPALAPDDLSRALVRTGIALAASMILFPPAWDAVIERSVLMAIFLIAFPCLTYLLLSSIWSIQKLQAAMRGAR
jgi:hypothetical protein